MKSCPVFICYRQVDGTKIARWLFENLHGQRLPDIEHTVTEEEVSSLDVYFDQTAPAVGDWKAIHQPHLCTSQAMIIVCTPGSSQRLDEKNDWVHLEIDWWLKNRKVAPILIDATGEGARWVPMVIKDRWPDAQRITVVQDDLLRLQGQELRLFEEQVRSRILNGIVLSKQRVVFEDLERQKKMSKRLSVALVVAIILLLSTVLAAVFAMRAWDSARENARIALARQLAAQAVARTQQTDLSPRSVLLAVESMRRFPSLEAEQVLRRALILLPRRVVCLDHDGGVLAVSFNPDGKRLATASGDRNAWLWDVPSGKRVARLTHRWYVTALAFSSDGRYLATGSGDRTARVWDASMGHELVSLSHSDDVRQVIFSQDGRYLATAGVYNPARIWDLENGRELTRMTHGYTAAGGPTGIYAIALSRDARYLATAANDYTARVWDVFTGSELKRMAHYDRHVHEVAFSPDGEHLATAGTSNPVRLWDVQSGREVMRLEYEGGHAGGQMAFSPDGTYIAANIADGLVRVWRVDSGTRIADVMHEDKVTNLVFSPSARFLATASRDRTARVWNIPSGREFTRILHEDEVNAIAFSPDERYVATGSGDKTACIWELGTDRTPEWQNVLEGMVTTLSSDGHFLGMSDITGTIRVFNISTGHEVARMANEEGVHTIVFDRTGKYLATAGGQVVKVWDMTTGHKVVRIHHDSGIRTFVLSPSGRFLATASHNNIVRVWQTSSGIEVVHMSHKMTAENVVNYLAFGPEDRYLAAASGTVRLIGNATENTWLWDMSSGREVGHSKRSKDGVTCLEFSPTEAHLAVGTFGGKVWLWKSISWQEPALVQHKGKVNAIAFSADGKYLVTASDDGTARVWNVDRRTEHVRIKHEDRVKAVAFSPDGQYLTTGGSDKTARVWRLKDGREVARLVHEVEVKSIAFGLHGEYLITTDSEHVTRRWFWRPSDLIRESCQRLTRNLKQAEWREYVGEEPFRRTCPDLPAVNRSDIEEIVEKAESLTTAGRVRETASLYQQAVEWAADWNDSGLNNLICRSGSLNGFADVVMEACERAVNQAPYDGRVYDSRGLARALTGEMAKAIEDFEFFIEWSKEYPQAVEFFTQVTAEKRKVWIAQLRDGQNPIDVDALRLLQQSE